MNLEGYTIIYDQSLSMADFESIGRYGVIKKRVRFVETDMPKVFNLVYGDIKDNDEINDNVISDNGDRDMLLATIAKVIFEYTTKYPDRFIYFEGSTSARTRLYQMAISIYLEELSQLFDIYAETEQDFEFKQFRKNMKVRSFLIKRKIT